MTINDSKNNASKEGNTQDNQLSNRKGKSGRSKSIPNIPQDSVEGNQAAQEQIIDALSTYVPEEITTKRLTPIDVNNVSDRLAKIKEISLATASRAISELIRKGAANANAKDTMTISIKCQESETDVEISRYDIGMALFSVVRHKVIRKLAEAMAPMMLQANLSIIRRVPTADLRGDLANKINRRLAIKSQNTPSGENPPLPLTREEEVCCCTYAQWMPNLNELAKSTRLKTLLEEDLISRKPRKRKANKKVKQEDPSKGKKEQKSNK